MSRPCDFEGCGKPMVARGLCGGHYYQRQLGRELTPLRLRGRPRGPSYRYRPRDELTGALLRAITQKAYERRVSPVALTADLIKAVEAL